MVKLLIADDHKVLRQALIEVLMAKGGYQIVGEASTGQELINALKHSEPDVVIMDVSMPDVGGLEVLQRLTNETNATTHPPILVLSADDGERNIRQVLKAGAKGFIPKNAGFDELEFAISSLHQGKTYLSPSITALLMKEGESEIKTTSPLSVLTKRELEILKYLADGNPNKVIGKKLHISTRTVDTHRSNILKKLNLKTNAELVKLAIAHGLISV